MLKKYKPNESIVIIEKKKRMNEKKTKQKKSNKFCLQYLITLLLNFPGFIIKVKRSVNKTKKTFFILNTKATL